MTLHVVNLSYCVIGAILIDLTSSQLGANATGILLRGS
jgi:hypothetical protein